MFIIESYTSAVIFCVITMICWGSWANTQKLAAGTWRFELFYWDYVAGILIIATLMGLTFGSSGDQGRPFLEDISQASLESVGHAMLGGIIFNAANILLVTAIAVAGMSVAFPVGIGIALVWGVIVNYMDNPVGNSSLLFTGVALIVAAIILNAYAYRRNTGRAKGMSVRGLLFSVAAGILMGFFYKYVAASMFADFTVPQAGKLSPYSAVFFFAAGVFLSNFLFNSIIMKKSVEGSPVYYRQYFAGTFRNHLMGMLGGAIWCIGMSCNILASGQAGPAISYGLGQGATVIAAIWGIAVWKEFRNAPKGTSLILNAMLICYMTGLGILIAAR
ncbi:GRP family sugar transporter [Dyadobacter sediminis]|uniref:Multidrug DMT transporter permease n=1 Tax=Dyadobacter sediminis TaxID=1493691 RepID=A0A5R9KCE9_9BACT|nr:GRP family sugar transporter [Dyadobacter sediminis]TLU92387.1 multidrug DMT transporter permease [Dyadobacter sediminis]GGB94859.1 multidrug DMT transporter permease [Dyadobacter sediminis]